MNVAKLSYVGTMGFTSQQETLYIAFLHITPRNIKKPNFRELFHYTNITTFSFTTILLSSPKDTRN